VAEYSRSEAKAWLRSISGYLLIVTTLTALTDH